MGGGCEQQLGVGGFKIEAHEVSRKVILNVDLLEAVVPSEPCCRQQAARVRQPCPPRIPVQHLRIAPQLASAQHPAPLGKIGHLVARVPPESGLRPPGQATSLSLGSVLDTSKSGEFGGLSQS